MHQVVVELPEADFITCLDLARAVAHAKLPFIHEEELAAPRNRASWTLPSFQFAEPGPNTCASARPQVGNPQENPFNDWRPATSERYLAECAGRLTELQEWVVRKELSIFTASHTKARAVTPGAYLRRVDAIRYCEESGMEVRDHLKPQSFTSIAVVSSAPVHARTGFGSCAPDVSDLDNANSASAAAPSAKPSTRLLRPKEAIARTGVSRSSFYEWQNPKSRYFDATFPKPIQIGQSAIGYREDELDAWIASKPSKQR